MNPQMQQLASRRFGGGQPDVKEAGLGGALRMVGGGQIPSQGQQAGGVPGETPAPGVTGVTPGAVERRMAPPATEQAGGAPMMGANPGFTKGNIRNQQPDLQGPARGELNAPVGNLENFLRNIQNRRSQER